MKDYYSDRDGNHLPATALAQKNLALASMISSEHAVRMQEFFDREWCNAECDCDNCYDVVIAATGALLQAMHDSAEMYTLTGGRMKVILSATTAVEADHNDRIMSRMQEKLTGAGLGLVMAWQPAADGTLYACYMLDRLE